MTWLKRTTHSHVVSLYIPHDTYQNAISCDRNHGIIAIIWNTYNDHNMILHS